MGGVTTLFYFRLTFPGVIEMSVRTVCTWQVTCTEGGDRMKVQLPSVVLGKKSFKMKYLNSWDYSDRAINLEAFTGFQEGSDICSLFIFSSWNSSNDSSNDSS